VVTTHKYFETVTDAIVLSVCGLASLYFLDDVVGVTSFSREFGRLILYSFFLGAPLAFVVALLARWKVGRGRFRVYPFITGALLALIGAFILIISKSQV